MEEETWENAMLKPVNEWIKEGNEVNTMLDAFNYFEFILNYLEENYTLFKKEKENDNT